jgi:Zn finger protein HypA/HybF involved in hydrogenase expression
MAGYLRFMEWARVDTVSVECATCDQNWTMNLHSVYEQQVIESRPCPKCESETLRCKKRKAKKSPVSKAFLIPSFHTVGSA